MPDREVLDPFPPVPLMIDSAIEALGVLGVLTVIYRHLENIPGNTNAMIRAEILSAIRKGRKMEEDEQEQDSAEKKQLRKDQLGYVDLDG